MGAVHMKRTVSLTEVQHDITTLITALSETTDALIIEHEGQPVAVLLSPAAYEQLLRSEAERDWMIIQQVRTRNAGKDPDAVIADVAAGVEAARRELREARVRSA